MKNVILVTGSSKGLGREIALAFAKNGDNVVIHGRNALNLLALEQEILKNSTECQIVIGDVRNDSTMRNLTHISRDFRVNILINNVGIYSNAEIKEIIDINLVSTIILTKSIFEIFKEQGHGLIININSLAGKYPNKEEAVYCASKHGLKGFMDSFKLEAMEHNVVVTDLYIGAMNTEMCKDRDNQDKLIRADEVAQVVLDIAKNYSTLRISELTILRKLY